jgi:hypothetical protein
MKRRFTKYPNSSIKASTTPESMTNQEAIGVLLYLRTLISDFEDIDEINAALALAVKALKAQM